MKAQGLRVGAKSAFGTDDPSTPVPDVSAAEVPRLWVTVSSPTVAARRQATLEGRFGEMTRTLAALETALAAIGAPAFVVDRDGNVLHGNARAYCLLEQKPRAILDSLTAILGSGRSELGWELTPLRGGGESAGFLAILKPSAAVATNGDSLRAATLAWRLTARQAQVLELLAHGLTNATIAEALGINEGTVVFHLSAIFDKAGVDNRARLIVRLLDL